jgi:isochorismate hydrolase
MFTIQTENYTLTPALLVIDVQNGFVSKGGSYDKLGMDTSNYRAVVSEMRELINLCREMKIPIFYTEAVREPSELINSEKALVICEVILLFHLHEILIVIRRVTGVRT